MRRVYDNIGRALDIEQPLSLKRDAVPVGSALGQRMAAPRFIESPQKRVIRSIEEQYPVRHARVRQRAQTVFQIVEKRAAPDIDHENGVSHFSLALPEQIQYIADKRRRQVVDAVISEIFKAVERTALARSRHARNNSDLHNTHL
jgi:hypothetical protein